MEAMEIRSGETPEPAGGTPTLPETHRPPPRDTLFLNDGISPEHSPLLPAAWSAPHGSKLIHHPPEAVEQIGEQLLLPRDDAGERPDVRGMRGVVDGGEEFVGALDEE